MSSNRSHFADEKPKTQSTARIKVLVSPREWEASLGFKSRLSARRHQAFTLLQGFSQDSLLWKVVK
jgi:hypothetical protein